MNTSAITTFEDDRLAVIETHPVQYHAPVYRVLQTDFDLPVTAIYGSDFSVAGYQDREFCASFAWDTDLLSGYSHVFIDRAALGGAQSWEQTSTRGLAQALRTARPRAILLLGYSPSFYRSAWRLARKLAVPLLFRGETTDHSRPRGLAKAFLRDWVLRKLYRTCDGLLHVGQRSLQHFRRLGCPDEKLFYSPYCVATELFATDEADRERLRPATRQTLGLASNQLALLFSGKLVERKGVEVLIAAAKRLPPAVRERLVLVFLGAGPLRSELDACAQASPRIQTRFLGFQNQRRLSAYYHAADLLVLPSLWAETWGLVVNEALHHGLPVVASGAVGCVPDLVKSGQTGEIQVAGSADSLAHALTWAFQLTGRPEIRSQCRQQVDSFTVHHAARGIVQAYREVIRQRTCRT
jgi:glycosyltransferase involved in cell wall biosynthesis